VMCWIFMFLHLAFCLQDGFFPTVLAEVRDYFDISYIIGGVLGTGYYVGNALASPFFGWIANFCPPARVLWVGSMVWLASTLLLTISMNWYEVLIFRFTMGIGKASLVSLGPVIIDLIAAPKRRSCYVALYFGAGPIGFSLGHVFGGLIIDSTWEYIPDDERWRIIYMVQGVIGLLSVVLFLSIRGPKNILALRPYDDLDDKSKLREKLKMILSNKTWILCTSAFAFQNFIVGGCGYYLIQYVMDVYDQSATTSGIILGIITLVTVITGNILGGSTLDWVLQRKDNTENELEMCTSSIAVTILYMVLTIPPALSLVFIEQLALFCFILTVTMLLMWMGSGPLNTSILWSVELRERTFSRSLSNIILCLFAYAPAPVVLGALKESVGWKWTMFCTFALPILLVSILVVAYFVHRKAMSNLNSETTVNYETTGKITQDSKTPILKAAV
jgi:MFS family permease